MEHVAAIDSTLYWEGKKKNTIQYETESSFAIYFWVEMEKCEFQIIPETLKVRCEKNSNKI